MKHSKIGYLALLMLIKYYIADFSPKKVYLILFFKGIDISLKTIHVYYKKIMLIKNNYVKNEMRNCILGGPVEIDESMIYKTKRGINRRGRIGLIRMWLFGLKCRNSGRIILYPVLKRTKVKLLLIILRHVRRGALIYSDCWSAYVNNHVTPKQSFLRPFGFYHLFVNHDYQFVSEVFPDIHTEF